MPPARSSPNSAPIRVEGVRSSLEVVPVAGTNVVEIAARGGRPEALAAIVNNVIEVYRERLANGYRSESGEAMAQAAEEAQRLEASVRAKRRDVESFRSRHNIVSLERDENQVLARAKGLAASLNAANEQRRYRGGQGSLAHRIGCRGQGSRPRA